MSMPLVGALLLVFNLTPLAESQNFNFDAASILQSEYEGNKNLLPFKIYNTIVKYTGIDIG
jgi:hypothetical protein